MEQLLLYGMDSCSGDTGCLPGCDSEIVAALGWLYL